jgi:hypothetical protein
MSETKNVALGAPEIALHAYHVTLDYLDFWLTLEAEHAGGDEVSDAVIRVLTERMSRDIQRVFVDAPAPELLPAVGQAFADFLLLWIRNTQGEAPWQLQESESARRPGSKPLEPAANRKQKKK